MRLGWGAGVAIAVLLSVAVFLFGFVDLTHMVSLILLIVGLWTIGGAFFVVERKDRNYYAGWGVVLGSCRFSPSCRLHIPSGYYSSPLLP